MAASRRRERTGQIVLLVAGGRPRADRLLVVAGAGGTAIWASTDKDSDGYRSTSVSTSSGSSAPGDHDGRTIDLGDETSPEWLFGKIRIEAQSRRLGARSSSASAARSDVERLPRGRRARTCSRTVDFDPFRDVTTTGRPGTQDAGAAQPPQTLLGRVRARRRARTSLIWRPTSATWSVVLMNADGSPGVDARVKAGAEIPYALWIGLGICDRDPARGRRDADDRRGLAAETAAAAAPSDLGRDRSVGGCAPAAGRRGALRGGFEFDEQRGDEQHGDPDRGLAGRLPRDTAGHAAGRPSRGSTTKWWKRAPAERERRRARASRSAPGRSRSSTGRRARAAAAR